MNRLKTAFTLAEAIIVFALLGTIAIIVIPSAINQQIKSQYRTKLWKALTTYNNAIETVISSQQISRTKEAWNSYINNDGKCGNAKHVFKIVEADSQNPCVFTTGAGIWWNFTNPSKVMVAFKKDDLKADYAVDMSDYRAFYLVSDFDRNGAPRVQELTYGYYAGSNSMILNSVKVKAFLEKKIPSEYIKMCGTDKKSCIYRGGNSSCASSNTCTCYSMDAWGKFSASRSNCDETCTKCKSAGIPYRNINSKDAEAKRFAENGYGYSIGENNLSYFWISASCSDIQGDDCNTETVTFARTNSTEFYLPPSLTETGITAAGFKTEEYFCPIGESNLQNCTLSPTSIYQYTVRENNEPHTYRIMPQNDGTYNFSHAEDNVGGISRNGITHESRTGCVDITCATYKSRTVNLFNDNEHPDKITGVCKYKDNVADSNNPAGCPPA